MQYEDEHLVRKLYEKLSAKEISYLFWSKVEVLLGGIMVGYILAITIHN